MSTLTQSTKIQIGLVLILVVPLIGGIITFTMVRMEAAALGVVVNEVKDTAAGTNKVTAELNQSLVRVQASVDSLTMAVTELKIDNNQRERDSQDRVTSIVRLESDLQSAKERLTTLDSSIRTIEARLLSLEINAATSRSNPSSGGPPTTGRNSE